MARRARRNPDDSEEEGFDEVDEEEGVILRTFDKRRVRRFLDQLYKLQDRFIEHQKRHQLEEIIDSLSRQFDNDLHHGFHQSHRVVSWIKEHGPAELIALIEHLKAYDEDALYLALSDLALYDAAWVAKESDAHKKAVYWEPGTLVEVEVNPVTLDSFTEHINED